MSKKKLTRSSKLKDWYKKVVPTVTLRNLTKRMKKHVAENPNDRQGAQKLAALEKDSYKKNPSNRKTRRRSYQYILPDWMIAKQRRGA